MSPHEKMESHASPFLQRMVGARSEEIPAVAWSLVYFVVLFLAYYVLRPIRDELGVAGGVRNLPWLFTGTLATMLVVSPLFAYAVRRFPRERFIAISYRFFPLNLVVNAITLFLQLFVTGWLMRWFGVLTTLRTLPVVSALGFGALATYPTVGVLVVAQVARRVSNFAFARPTREVLFTSSVREHRYKAKNFIDTVIYRGGDQVGSWSYAGLLGLGVSITQISVIAVPLSLIWLLLRVFLGWAHERTEARLAEDPAKPVEGAFPAKVH